MRAILCAAVAAVAGSAASGQQPTAELKMGMLQGMFRDVKPVMVQALSKPFRELMLKQTGYGGDVELCADALGLADKLKDKSLHIGVFHGFEFAWAQQKCPDLVPLVVTRPLGGTVQAVVVVHNDAPYQAVADLKDEPVLIPRGAKAHSLAFLDKLRAGMEKGTLRTEKKLDLTAADALAAVAAGEATAALVDVAAMEGFRQLQPGAVKHLRVLQRSEAFPPAVVAYRKGTFTDAEAARIRAGLADAQNTPTGKMLLTVWSLNGFEPPPAEHQAQLDAILKAYPVPAPPTVRTAGAREPSEK